MLNLDSDTKIYLSSGITDMRKGINGLSILASVAMPDKKISTGAMFVFRGKRSDKIKILWWDGQGFCLFYKCLDKGKFTWPKSTINGNIRINCSCVAAFTLADAVVEEPTNHNRKSASYLPPLYLRLNPACPALPFSAPT
jgi:transposase